MILFQFPVNEHSFQQNWQTFLGLAEKKPGLQPEIVSHMVRILIGKPYSAPALIHALLFDARETEEAAMQSPAWQAAGKFLQAFTTEKGVLVVAESGSWGQ